MESKKLKLESGGERVFSYKAPTDKNELKKIFKQSLKGHNIRSGDIMIEMTLQNTSKDSYTFETQPEAGWLRCVLKSLDGKVLWKNDTYPVLDGMEFVPGDKKTPFCYIGQNEWKKFSGKSVRIDAFLEGYESATKMTTSKYTLP